MFIVSHKPTADEGWMEHKKVGVVAEVYSVCSELRPRNVFTTEVFLSDVGFEEKTPLYLLCNIEK